jgi:hypothetical protein
MNAANIENLFEECLGQLAAGADLEEVLANFPGQADELRPMLQAAINLQQISAEIKPPQTAQMRSRAQFLTTAAGMAPSSQKRGFQFSLFHLRLAASSAVLIGILAAIMLLGTGFASADALPGDVFYPVKIMVEQMQINMVQDPPARLEMENMYDDRRQEEVSRLTKMQRREQVTFSGFLKHTGDGKWMIGSVKLIFPVSGPDPSDFEDAYVEIVGMSDSQEVEVQSIKLRRLQWDGILQKFDDQSWRISGLTIMLTEDTEITGGQPQIGATVRVVAVRPSGDHYAALELSVKSLPPTVVKLLPDPTQTSTRENAEPRESGENKQPTSKPKVASPTPSQEAQPTRTRENEEENRKKSKPSPTPTKKSEEYHPTRTPTRTPQATKAPTATPDSTQTPESTSTHDD